MFASTTADAVGALPSALRCLLLSQSSLCPEPSSRPRRSGRRRGRMREDPEESNLYTVPDASPRGLILASIGAAISLASGLAGLLL